MTGAPPHPPTHSYAFRVKKRSSDFSIKFGENEKNCNLRETL
jgi:hypothetical protein